jgi:hypothetical protein
MPTDSLKHVSVNPFAVENPEDPDLCSDYFVYDSIIPDTEFPVSLQGPSQRCSIVLGSRNKTDLKRTGDSALDIDRKIRQILFHHLGMVDEGGRHSATRPLQMCPNLGMSQGLLAVEGPFSFRREKDQCTILLGLQSFFDQVSDLE